MNVYFVSKIYQILGAVISVVSL